MTKRYEISKPVEGMKTLSAQFSLLRLEKTIEWAKKMRLQGKPEQEIIRQIQNQHSDLDQPSRHKIYQLTLGKKVSDDIRRDDIEQYIEIKKGTAELTLKKPQKNIHEGSFLFFEGKRWVVVGQEDLKLDLKQV